MKEILSDWGWLVGILLSTITFGTIVAKYLKGVVSNIINEANNPQNESIKDIKETQEKMAQNVENLQAAHEADRIATQAALRSTITNIYFKYKECDELPYYEKENLDKLYSAYTGIGGNSFVTDLYKELTSKKIK